MGNIQLAKDMYDNFPFSNECTAQDMVIMNELNAYFARLGNILCTERN